MKKSTTYLLNLGAISIALLTSSCAEHNLRKLETSPHHGLPFAKNLAAEYNKLARKESDIYNDQLDADYFAVKGLQAATGLEVLPEDPNNRDIPEAALTAIREGRERLIFALDKSGRMVAPELAATAQVAYDCWIEETEEDFQPDQIKKCHKLFMDSLEKLEKAVQQEAPTFMVFFPLNSHELTPEAKKMIKEAANVATQLGTHTINVTGHADGVGGRKHNLKLTQNRASVVRDMLIQEGIEAKRIVAVGGGEMDGTPEVYPRNRRVDIHIH